MDYGNHFVREALCTFRFASAGQITDYLEYTWRFYQAIKEEGFTQTTRRPVQVNFKIGPNISPEEVEPVVTQGTQASVFTNASTGYSIILDEHLISFNCVKNYTGWDRFISELVVPYIHKFAELGIPQQLQSAQMAYINDLPLNEEEQLSDYLNFVPVIRKDDEVSAELAIGFQGHYQLANNVVASLQVALNPAMTNNEKRAIIECNSIATFNKESLAAEWISSALELANQAHSKARIVFESIATPHFKQRIK